MKPIRTAFLALIYSALPAFAAYAAGDSGPPPDKAHSLFNAFEVMCDIGRPDFEHLSAQAKAMRMQVLDDVSETTANGETIRRRAWVGTLSTGPFALRAEKMSGAKDVATSCSVEAQVPDAAALRALVTGTLHLPAASEHRVGDGEQADYWDNYAGNGMTLVVRDMARPSSHLVQVKLMDMYNKNAP